MAIGKKDRRTKKRVHPTRLPRWAKRSLWPCLPIISESGLMTSDFMALDPKDRLLIAEKPHAVHHAQNAEHSRRHHRRRPWKDNWGTPGRTGRRRWLIYPPSTLDSNRLPLRQAVFMSDSARFCQPSAKPVSAPKKGS